MRVPIVHLNFQNQPASILLICGNIQLIGQLHDDVFLLQLTESFSLFVFFMCKLRLLFFNPQRDWQIYITKQTEMNSGSCRQISSSCNCPNGSAEGGRGEEVSPRKSVVQSACQYHASREWLSKWLAKCSSKRRIKISNLSLKYCSDFLDLEILRSLLS